MIKGHDAEHLMLYLDIRRYKQIPDVQLRGMLAREIYGELVHHCSFHKSLHLATICMLIDTFICRSARHEVNISDIMRKNLEAKCINRSGGPPSSDDFAPELFFQIEIELIRLINVLNLLLWFCPRYSRSTLNVMS
jgi:hypothetical protein